VTAGAASVDATGRPAGRVTDGPRAYDRPPDGSPRGKYRLAIDAGAALVLANVRYWRTVAPLVRGQLRHWRRRAEAIEDGTLRDIALAKLDEESFNAEAGAMLATFVPANRRAIVVEAIVALQVLFDVLDGLSEQPSPDPLGDGTRLFEIFTAALAETGPSSVGSSEPDGYLLDLSRTAAGALARLPARAAVAERARAGAHRAADAQVRVHAVALLGRPQLEQWAEAQAQGTGLKWREFAAGSASSVLALHALCAAAADPGTTPARAEMIDAAYLPICALLTLLDGLTDRERDERAGEQSFTALFEDPEELSCALVDTAALARRRTGQLEDEARHVMILTAVVAYYASTAGARSDHARPIVNRLQDGLRPLSLPTLVVLRTWRLAKRLRSRREGVHGAL
jgi:tetraprenyl-beta-curcumene synthase